MILQDIQYKCFQQNKKGNITHRDYPHLEFKSLDLPHLLRGALLAVDKDLGIEVPLVTSILSKG